MEPGAGLLASVESAARIPDRRQRHHYRQRVHSLAYVNVEQGNGGIVRDVSEAGVAIQAVARLHANQQVFLRFDLLSPRLRIEATGCVAWADSTGQAGIEFRALPQRSRRLLRDWIFAQALTTAEHVSQNSIFCQNKQSEAAPELSFSATDRGPIRLAPEGVTPSATAEKVASPPLKFSWFPFLIPRRLFSRGADALIILLAVLLFAVLAGAIAQSFPPWPAALRLALAVCGIFAALYWYLFRVWIGATPGVQFTRLLIRYCENTEIPEDDPPRFR
jgi:PilZ domain